MALPSASQSQLPGEEERHQAILQQQQQRQEPHHMLSPSPIGTSPTEPSNRVLLPGADGDAGIESGGPATASTSDVAMNDDNGMLGPFRTERTGSANANGNGTRDGAGETDKYKKLKRKYFEIKENRDDTAQALDRAQRTIGKLRQERDALLDRLRNFQQGGGARPADGWNPPGNGGAGRDNGSGSGGSGLGGGRGGGAGPSNGGSGSGGGARPSNGGSGSGGGPSYDAPSPIQSDDEDGDDYGRGGDGVGGGGGGGGKVGNILSGLSGVGELGPKARGQGYAFASPVIPTVTPSVLTGSTVGESLAFVGNLNGDLGQEMGSGAEGKRPPRKKSRYWDEEERRESSLKEAVKLGLLTPPPSDVGEEEAAGRRIGNSPETTTGTSTTNATASATVQTAGGGKPTSIKIRLKPLSTSPPKVENGRAIANSNGSPSLLDLPAAKTEAQRRGEDYPDSDSEVSSVSSAGSPSPPREPDARVGEPYFNDNGELVDPSIISNDALKRHPRKSGVGRVEGDEEGAVGGVGETTTLSGSGLGGSSISTLAQVTEKTTKPKRLKSHSVITKTVNIPPVPRNPDGTAVLPMQCGVTTLYTLGSIKAGQHFSTERYIFPIGYEVSRVYNSMVNPEALATYRCRILDGGDQSPRFEIEADDQTNKIVAGTATGAWSQVVKTANKVREKEASNSVSGPDYYGLGHPTVKHLIQELDGAKDLPDYVWQNYVEVEPPTSKREKMRREKVERAERQAALEASKTQMDDDDNPRVSRSSIDPQLQRELLDGTGAMDLDDNESMGGTTAAATPGASGTEMETPGSRAESLRKGRGSKTSSSSRANAGDKKKSGKRSSNARGGGGAGAGSSKPAPIDSNVGTPSSVNDEPSSAVAAPPGANTAPSAARHGMEYVNDGAPYTSPEVIDRDTEYRKRSLTLDTDVRGGYGGAAGGGGRTTGEVISPSDRHDGSSYSTPYTGGSEYRSDPPGAGASGSLSGLLHPSSSHRHDSRSYGVHGSPTGGPSPSSAIDPALAGPVGSPYRTAGSHHKATTVMPVPYHQPTGSPYLGSAYESHHYPATGSGERSPYEPSTSPHLGGGYGLGPYYPPAHARYGSGGHNSPSIGGHNSRSRSMSGGSG